MKNNQPHSTGHFVRKSFLVLEVFIISVFLLGGSSFPDSFLTHISDRKEIKTENPAEDADKENTDMKHEDIEKTETQQNQQEETKSHKTPEYDWENYRTIAHALGGLDGKTYLNSKESFIESYEKGCRLFEVDLVRTSDQIWVCRHSWNQSLGQWDEEEKKVLTADEFLNAPIYGKYTPMSLRDLLILLKDYPDAFVLLDSKQYSIRNYRKTIEDYAEYLEIATEADAKESLDQIIPEIYNEAMFPGTALAYRFPSYVYSLWQEYTIEEITEIGDFCKEKGIPAVTVYEEYWTEEIQKIFDSREILVYVYTVNDPDKAVYYMENGAAGICTDTLLE